MKRTWIVAIAAIAVIVVMVVSLSSLGPDPTTSTAPSLAALPTLQSTAVVVEPMPSELAGATEPPAPTVDPRSVRACRADQVAALAGGWSGATGSLAGNASVINVSSEACSVAGKPSMELLDKAGTLIASGVSSTPGEPAVLPPGGVTGVIAVWSNWCHDPPAMPLSLRFKLAGTGLTLRAAVVDWSGAVGGSESSSLPRCDAPGAPSEIGAPVPFTTPGPPEPAEPGIDDGICAVEDLVGFRGRWGAAAGTSYTPVVVFNRGGVGCVLEKDPPVALRDADGKLLMRGGAEARKGPLQLPAGVAAIASLGFGDWCLPAPKLPFEFGLEFEDDVLALTPTSKGSAIGVPACGSDPPSGSPDLFLSDPLALPDF